MEPDLFDGSVQSMQLQLQKANHMIAELKIKYQMLKQKFRFQKQHIVVLEQMKGIRMSPLEIATSVMEFKVSSTSEEFTESTAAQIQDNQSKSIGNKTNNFSQEIPQKTI